MLQNCLPQWTCDHINATHLKTNPSCIGVPLPLQDDESWATHDGERARMVASSVRDDVDAYGVLWNCTCIEGLPQLSRGTLTLEQSGFPIGFFFTRMFGCEVLLSGLGYY